MFFENRYDAGKKLAEIISKRQTQWDDIVGIARGGVVIAHEIAKLKGIRPKSICVEDLYSEDCTVVASSLGSGAIFSNSKNGEQGRFITNMTTVDNKLLLKTIDKQKTLSQSQSTDYGSNILLCDDGIVSGHTMLTAIEAFKFHGIKKITVAIPVILPWFVEHAAQNDIEVITWRISKMTNPSTGVFYLNFSDTLDSEVISILKN